MRKEHITMKKRFLAAVLAALLCAGLAPSAPAAFTDVADPETARAARCASLWREDNSPLEAE